MIATHYSELERLRAELERKRELLKLYTHIARVKYPELQLDAPK